MFTKQEGKCPWFKSCVGAQCHFAISVDEKDLHGYDMDKLYAKGYVNNLGVACVLRLLADKYIKEKKGKKKKRE